MPERNALIAWLITERPLGVNCNSEKSGMAIAETEALLTRIESAGSFTRATDRCRAWANPSRSTRCPVGTDVRRCGTTCRRASDRHVAISASDGRVEGLDSSESHRIHRRNALGTISKSAMTLRTNRARPLGGSIAPTTVRSRSPLMFTAAGQLIAPSRPHVQP
jgi:hypothetical protein